MRSWLDFTLSALALSPQSAVQSLDLPAQIRIVQRPDMKTIRPIHPFPARMAPDVALDQCIRLRPGSTVLDPMVGSGVVVRVASEYGHRAIGFDMDPLAVLMSRVWTTTLDVPPLLDRAQQIVERAEALAFDHISLPWIDEDPETQEFIDFWFGEPQKAELRRLAYVLAHEDGAIGNALRLALSRIIVTKDRGASLARDVSHSRPHRAFDHHDFPVISEFQRSVRSIAERLSTQPPQGNVQIDIGDARQLTHLGSGSVDAVITSPPYLNAIDYLRGHRLALVWLGYRLAELRRIRSNSIGAERSPDSGLDTLLARELYSSMTFAQQLPPREQRIFERYILDLVAAISELHRVLRAEGTAVFVVGNSWIRGVFVKNTQVVTEIAKRLGFRFVSERERTLPASHRYLPPPTQTQQPALQRRMRTENVLEFVRD